MKAAPMLLLLAACAPSAEVLARDAGYLRNRSLRIAVLDVSDRSGLVESAALQGQLAQRLREIGWSGASTHAEKALRQDWPDARAAAEALRRGADAALTASVTLADGAPPPKRADDEASVWAAPAGRRDYYRREMRGEGWKGPRVRAEVRLVDAKSESVVYRAGYEGAAGGLSEEDLAAALLRPLED
jgi:hypothetical protein